MISAVVPTNTNGVTPDAPQDLSSVGMTNQRAFQVSVGRAWTRKKQWASINGGCRWSNSPLAEPIGLLAPLAALGLLVLIVVGAATSGRPRLKLYKPIDETDRIDDWLYYRRHFSPLCCIIVSAGGSGLADLDRNPQRRLLFWP